MIDAATLKSAAAGREREILSQVAGIPDEHLDGRGHPCMKCGGDDRFSLVDAGRGAVICRNCFSQSNGDFLSAIQWAKGLTFPEAVDQSAKFLGLNGYSKGQEVADPAEHLKFLDWHEGLANTWCVLHKPGITPAAMLAAGCRRARYRDQHTVFAFPTWGPQLMAADPVGWTIYDVSGRTLPVAKGKVAKSKVTKGSKTGIVGPVERLSGAREVWLVEGPPDMLAFNSLVDLPADVIAITNANGASEGPRPWLLDMLKGKIAPLVRDCDVPGEKSALGDVEKNGRRKPGWLAKCSAYAAECPHVRLPYPITGDNGRDLRDFIVEGHTYGDLKKMAEESGETDGADGEADAIVAAAASASLPEVRLPGGEVKISDAAAKLGDLLGESGRFYVRGGLPVRRIDDEGSPRLEPIRAAALCSDLESVAWLVKVVATSGKPTFETVPTNCPEGTARLLLESAALRAALPAIKIVSRCPVLIERDGRLVEVTGYDRDSGILATGEPVPKIELPEAVELLRGLFVDTRCATAGDKARALAAVVTPAMLFGDLLGGRAPIDLGEADDSQSGKGYRNKVTAAIYNSTPRTVTQRATGGVGSLQETFDAVLVAGANFVPFDNFRGRLDLPGLESFLTEDVYMARIPYSGPAAIDPKRIVVMLTSNAAEVTVDLANRCSCTRILKQPDDHQFRSFPEGDLLDHVRANQPKYLGAVFAVVREWHRLGKPLLPTSDHDFRRWGRTLGFISERILEAGGLLVGHRAAQQRIASPGLTWLRDVAIAVHKAKKSGKWLRSHQLLDIIAAAGIDQELVADANDDSGWQKAVRKLGMKLSRQFPQDTVLIDNHRIERREVADDQYRRQREYAFSSKPPNTPEPTPELKPANPEPPEPLSTFTRTHAPARVQESSQGVRGVQGCSGAAHLCNAGEHSWTVVRDGDRHKQVCEVCGKFYGWIPEGVQ